MLCFKCPGSPRSPRSLFIYFQVEYLLLSVTRLAASDTAGKYCRSNWLFPARLDTSFLNPLLSSIMERRGETHESSPLTRLPRNYLFHFSSVAVVVM